MDQTERDLMSNQEYEAIKPDLDIIREWFAESCSLRFISAVHANEENPNAGFVQLIPQGY